MNSNSSSNKFMIKSPIYTNIMTNNNNSNNQTTFSIIILNYFLFIIFICTFVKHNCLLIAHWCLYDYVYATHSMQNSHSLYFYVKSIFSFLNLAVSIVIARLFIIFFGNWNISRKLMMNTISFEIWLLDGCLSALLGIIY